MTSALERHHKKKAQKISSWICISGLLLASLGTKSPVRYKVRVFAVGWGILPRIPLSLGGLEASRPVRTYHSDTALLAPARTLIRNRTLFLAGDTLPGGITVRDAERMPYRLLVQVCRPVDTVELAIGPELFMCNNRYYRTTDNDIRFMQQFLSKHQIKRYLGVWAKK